METTISAEEISMAGGVLLSLGISYIPGLNVKFAALHPTYKRLVMLGMLILVAAGAFGLGCIGQSNVECSEAGAWGLGRALILAVIANQSAFAISPRVEEVEKESTLAKYRKPTLGRSESTA